MCGIAGIVYSEKGKPVDVGILRRMNAALTHRGPDDEGYFIEGNVGLAMRRLSIIDLEKGHQPIANETETVWTVFNGEIYNFPELREELTGKGHRFRTRTDTEVIVHLYEEEGELFVNRLRGMFAIALWDKRNEKLLLYRDRVGIKPLHYWIRDGALAFGSEIKAILEYPAVGRDISLSALNDYLGFFYIPGPKTIYSGIKKLLPGHFLRYHNAQTEILSYWDFAYRPENGSSEKRWVDELRATLEESVRIHLVSDVPLGAFLSGGMDSSTVVAWMSRQQGSRVKTYSIGFSDSRFNELPYAREVAGCFNTDHHEAVVEADAVKLLPRIIRGFDEPFADSSAIPTYIVSEFARREVTVALSGDGGDELFCGYLWTCKEAWLEKYRKIPACLRRGAEKALLRKGYEPFRQTGLWDRVRRFFHDAGLSPVESFARRAMCFQPSMKQALLQPWVLDELRGEDSLKLVRDLFERGAAATVMDKSLYFDSKVYLPDDLLTKVDRMSMLHSLEVRVPILDHKVVELACRMPFSLKLKGWTTKYILKRAMEGILPPTILRQRKQGFSIPIHRWFREDLYEMTRKLLTGEGSMSKRFFRPECVSGLLEEHRSGKKLLGTQLYALTVFELWLRLTEQGRGGTIPADLTIRDIV